MALLVQQCLPALLLSTDKGLPLSVTLHGGSNAEMAPQIDYIDMARPPSPMLKLVAYRVDIQACRSAVRHRLPHGREAKVCRLGHGHRSSVLKAVQGILSERRRIGGSAGLVYGRDFVQSSRIDRTRPT